MRSTRLFVAVVLTWCCRHSGAFDVEGGGPGARPPLPGQIGNAGAPSQLQQPVVARPGSIGGQVADAAAKVSSWYRAYQGFVAAAAKVNQLISFCCGVWLVMSFPLTLIGAGITLKLTEAGQVIFLAMYGLLLLGVEIPLSAVQTALRQYFFFVYTRPGRAAFVFNIALVCWQCQSVGFVTKALMSFNAILTLYILNSQDRRFAQVDAEAREALQQASEEMRGSVSDALSFTKMFSGAFGGANKGFGASRGASSTPAAPAASGGGFSSRPQPEVASGQSAWPTGGGGGGAGGGA